MDLQPVHDLMQKKSSRKDFLKHVGLAALGIHGISSFLPHLAAKASAQSTCDSRYGSGSYGHGVYGPRCDAPLVPPD